MKPVSIWAAAALVAGLGFGLLQCSGYGTGPSPQSDDSVVFKTAFSSTSPEVLAFLAKAQGGAKAKLAYIDKTGPSNQLTYIDFSEGTTPVPRVVAAAKGAAVPVISPDGRWAVYASGSGVEAGSPVGKRSSVYFIELREDAQPLLLAKDSACEPRFKQNSSKLTVIYTTLCPDLAWEGFGMTMETDVDVSGAAPTKGEVRTLFPHGSYTGGLSWDGKFLCGGGEHVAMIDLTKNKTRPDTLSLGGIQSCNASISSSREFTNTMLYLNTSGQTPRLNGNQPWGEWQAILISNSDKKLVKGYMNPDGDPRFPLETNPASLSGAKASKWHHSEWSNHPYFAAATLNVNRFFKVGTEFKNTAFQERLYVINLRDSSYLEVLRPDSLVYKGKSIGGFYWPYLWVEIPSGFQESKTWLVPST